jgi:hypothetical protein
MHKRFLKISCFKNSNLRKKGNIETVKATFSCFLALGVGYTPRLLPFAKIDFFF